MKLRDLSNGKYTHSVEAVCVCGHALGLHAHSTFKGKRPCLAGDLGHAFCECERFRKSKRADKPVAE